MALIYKHGTYGEFAETQAGVATQSGTLAVYCYGKEVTFKNAK